MTAAFFPPGSCVVFVPACLAGNLESDLQAGAQAGYSLLWVLWWSTIIGMFLQLYVTFHPFLARLMIGWLVVPRSVNRIQKKGRDAVQAPTKTPQKKASGPTTSYATEFFKPG